MLDRIDFMANKRKGNPQSIRWKWGFRLTITFSLFFLFSSAILMSGIHQNLYQKEEENAKEMLQSVIETFRQVDTRLTKSNVESLIDKISVSTTTKGLKKVDNIPYLEDLKSKGITLRVFDVEGDLLYESQKSNTTFQKTSGYYFQTQQINNRDAFIGGSTILGETRSLLLGYVQVTFRLTEYHEIIAYNNKYFFLLQLVGVVLSVIFGYGSALLFFKPIKHMADTMNEITEDTLSQTRIKIKERRNTDELTDLSIQINNLMDKMAHYVTQQKQFVEDVSHELRTPTAIVEGHLKLLNRWGKDDPQVLDESLAASLNEITRMKTLVQEMLDLSRAEQVQIHYQNEETPIISVVTQIFHNFEMLYPEFHLYLDQDIDEERYVNVYRNHLEQVLVILLDNAVKYSLDRKEIHISLSETLSKVQIAIQDFGEGMSQKDQQKIFNRFYRIDKARTRESGGHGLGLAIAKELLEGYKGDISVESVLGHGTIFRIQLPYIQKEITEEK